jgi:hypothetical protein
MALNINLLVSIIKSTIKYIGLNIKIPWRNSECICADSCVTDNIKRLHKKRVEPIKLHKKCVTACGMVSLIKIETKF